MSLNTNIQNEDRIDAFKKRIVQLKTESVDPQFSAYLEQILSNLEKEENTIQKMERHVEQNYQYYLRRNAMRMPQPEQQPVQSATVPQLEQKWMPQQQPQPMYEQWQPQPTFQPQPVQQPAVPVKDMRSKSWEFKIGTFVLGIVGIVFLLISFVTFGLQYMSTTLQGILFYILSIAIFALSELFLSKRLEKFSYFTSGLGIAGIYITTILNYLYLEILPAWAAMLITIVVTGFFFWLSRMKDSGMIRIICLLGCYVSLVPLGDLDNLAAFVLPATIVFALNLAGFLCPIRHGNVVTDYIQYICTIALSFRMVYLLYISGLEMWPFYIFICCNILTLHLLCCKKLDWTRYQILYSLTHGVFLGFLIYVGYHEDWMIFGVVGLSILCIGFMWLFRKTKMRFMPYVFTAVYAFLAFALDGDAFNLTIICMIIFVLNRLLAVFTDGFALFDAVYTMLIVWGVCLGCRTDELRMLGYVFASLILIGAFFVNKMKHYHLYLAVSFAWLFLVTESTYPLICSVLICILAACLIGGGFIKKEKPIRVYGLCLMIFVTLKLAAYDFKDADALTRILVFMIVGLVILGVSFLYIYLEKRQNEEDKRINMNQQPDGSQQIYMNQQTNEMG